MKRTKQILATVLCCMMLASCSTMPTDQKDQLAAQVEQIASSVSWIIPIADALMVLAPAETRSAYAVVRQSAMALSSLATQVVAAHRTNPTPESYAELARTLKQLKKAWTKLDKIYKGGAK